MDFLKGENIFANNKGNKFNLQKIEEMIVINENSRFNYNVDVSDGMYYLDDNWSYIEIKDGKLIRRVHFSNPDGDETTTYIFINEFTDEHIKIYSIDSRIDNNKINLDGIVPNEDEALKKLDIFHEILCYSSYSITNPYIFRNIKTEGGNKLQLVQGKIVPY